MANASPPTVASLFTALTRDQFRAMMVSSLVAAGIRADLWYAGGVASTILTYAAAALASMATLVAILIQNFYLSTSSGVGLRVLAVEMYGVTLPQATFASGPVIFANSSGNNYPLAAGGLIVTNPTTNVQYVNPDALTIGPGATVTVANMTAITQGTAGNAAPGEVDTMVSSLLGVTCTNPISIVGLDAPNDTAVKTLCLNSLGIRSVRGPRTAYGYAIQVATNPVTGATVNINRWGISEASHTGTVVIYVAGPGGTTDPDDVTGVETSIEAIARPSGVIVVVTPATVIQYTAAITVYAKAPAMTTADTIQQIAASAITNLLVDYPIGGLTASDDSHLAGVSGLFGATVEGAIAVALAAAGCQLVSTIGIVDQLLTQYQVLADGATITARIVNTTGGTV